MNIFLDKMREYIIQRLKGAEVLSIESINNMMGISQEDTSQALKHQAYLRQHKVKFMAMVATWLAEYKFVELKGQEALSDDYYEVLICGRYDDAFYRQQHLQIVAWYQAGLSHVRVTLLLNKLRQLFFACADNGKMPELALALGHALDIAQTIAANVYSIAAMMEKMQQKFQMDVTRLARSYELIETPLPADLMQAYLDHVNWKIRAFSLALGAKVVEGLPMSTHACKLGMWLDSGGWVRIPENKRTAFDEAHHRVHHLGADVLENARLERPENIIKALADMEEASDEVALTLVGLMEEELLSHIKLDALTKLPCRKAFDERLEQNVAFAKRNGMSVGLIIIDVDHFKSINDTHGHLVGDEVLKQLADILVSELREEEVAFRWGGEEFAVMTLNMFTGSTHILAERIRTCVEKTVFCAGTPYEMSITVSCGAVCFDVKDDLSMHQIFSVADQQLYQAKQKGRNCVEHTIL